MERRRFTGVVEGVLDSLPEEFRRRIRNVAVLVEDVPPDQQPPRPGHPPKVASGYLPWHPNDQKSVFNLPTGPDYIVLYQQNIEAVCSSEAEIRHQIRQTVIHELGHYFGMSEEQLRDV